MIFLKILLYTLLGILALALAFVVLVIVSSLFVDPGKLYSTDSRYYRFLLYASTAIAMVLVRIRIDRKGLDKLPEGRFLLVANHKSKFDPIVTWHVMRDRDLAYISKKENFDVPFFGRIIRRCCFMDIDRENARKAVKTVNHAADLIKNDVASVAVYPEGTRNNGDRLLPFHNGMFLIAKKAGVPVVIMSTHGTEDIKNNFPIHSSRVSLSVLDVIPAEKVREMRTDDIGNHAYDVLLKDVTEYESGKKTAKAAADNTKTI